MRCFFSSQFSDHTPQAETELLSRDLDKEYAGILGYEDFQESAAVLAFGQDCDKIKDKLVSTLALNFKGAPNEKEGIVPVS